MEPVGLRGRFRRGNACATNKPINQRVKAIIDETRKLSKDERRQLFDQLETNFFAELSDGAPAEIEAAWMEVDEHRIATRERGVSKTIDLDDVLQKARRRIAGS